MTVAEHKPFSPQLRAVYDVLQREGWWTLGDIRAACVARGQGISEASVSARLRELRGRGYVIDRAPSGRRGIYLYRIGKDD